MRARAALPAKGHPGEDRLIFRWPERSASFALPLLFLGSVVAHALAFYVFQVVYPPTVSITPPPAQVTLLTPSSIENEALLRWLDAQDPATPARSREIVPPDLGEILYTPSYVSVAVHTAPREVEHAVDRSTFPPARTTLALITPPAPQTVTRRGVAHSKLSFSENLRGRDADSERSVALGIKSDSSLQPSHFLVGVSDRGEVRYCFLQESCGNPSVDEAAEAALRQRAFRPVGGGSALVWGFAEFTWGVEAFNNPPSRPSGAPAAQHNP